MDNLLLAKFPEEAREHLRPHSERVTLRRGDHAVVPDEPIRHCYFPTTCLLSMMTTMSDGSSVECGAVGREGMSGICVLMDAGQTTMPTVCQVPGEAVRIRAQAVREVYEQNAAARRLLNRYVHTVVVNGSHAAACNRLHSLEQRFCKWLLMSADGIASGELDITHEYLAVMLGVRRAGVTEAAVKMKDAGLIDYKRGRVRLLDRSRFEALACECYGRTKAEYERLFA